MSLTALVDWLFFVHLNPLFLSAFLFGAHVGNIPQHIFNYIYTRFNRIKTHKTPSLKLFDCHKVEIYPA